jgi:hypothetical protein
MRSSSYYELEIKNKNKKEILSFSDSKNKNCVNVFIEDSDGDDEGTYMIVYMLTCIYMHICLLK